MNKEPTQEEIKRFWEHWGFKRLPDGKRYYHFEQTAKVMDWQASDGTIMAWLPRIDLNSLFKWAVPKLQEFVVTLTNCGGSIWEAELAWLNHSNCYNTKHKDPALALFWAIYSIIDNSPPW